MEHVKEQRVLSISLNNVPRFTKTHYFDESVQLSLEPLWDSNPIGPCASISATCYDSIYVSIDNVAVELALQYSQKHQSDRYECIFVATPTVSADEIGFHIQLSHFDSGMQIPGQAGLNPTITTPGDIYLPAVITSDNVQIQQPTVKQYKTAMEFLMASCSTNSELDLANFIQASAMICRKYFNQLVIEIELLTIATKFEAMPIQEVQLLPSALVKSLSHDCNNKSSEPRNGYIAINKSQNIMLVLESDLKVPILPIVGVWVNNVDSVQHPFVWMACLRYLHTSAIEKRICKPPKPFLLAVYYKYVSAAQFYNCTVVDQSDQFKFDLYKGNKLLQMPEGSAKEKQCSVDLVKLGSGSTHLESFSKALKLLVQKHKKNEVTGPWTPSAGDQDTEPRNSPSPYPSGNKAQVIEPSVPEPSLIFGEDNSPKTIEENSKNLGTARMMTYVSQTELLNNKKSTKSTASRSNESMEKKRRRNAAMESLLTKNSADQNSASVKHRSSSLSKLQNTKSSRVEADQTLTMHKQTRLSNNQSKTVLRKPSRSASTSQAETSSKHVAGILKNSHNHKRMSKTSSASDLQKQKDVDSSALEPCNGLQQKSSDKRLSDASSQRKHRVSFRSSTKLREGLSLNTVKKVKDNIMTSTPQSDNTSKMRDVDLSDVELDGHHICRRQRTPCQCTHEHTEKNCSSKFFEDVSTEPSQQDNHDRTSVHEKPDKNDVAEEITTSHNLRELLRKQEEQLQALQLQVKLLQQSQKSSTSSSALTPPTTPDMVTTTSQTQSSNLLSDVEKSTTVEKPSSSSISTMTSLIWPPPCPTCLGGLETCKTKTRNDDNTAPVGNKSKLESAACGKLQQIGLTCSSSAKDVSNDVRNDAIVRKEEKVEKKGSRRMPENLIKTTLEAVNRLTTEERFNSMETSLHVDVQSFVDSSCTTRSGSEITSPILGESASMRADQLAESPNSDNGGNEDVFVNTNHPHFYRNIMDKIHKFLTPKNVEADETKQQQASLPVLTPQQANEQFHTRTQSEPSLSNIACDEANNKSSDSHTEYIVPPRLQYVSLMQDISNTDTSTQINTLAAKYLGGKNVTPQRSTGTLLRKALTEGATCSYGSSDITLYGMSSKDLSLATNRYMIKHGLIPNPIKSADKIEDTNTHLVQTQAIHSKMTPLSAMPPKLQKGKDTVQILDISKLKEMPKLL